MYKIRRINHVFLIRISLLFLCFISKSEGPKCCDLESIYHDILELKYDEILESNCTDSSVKILVRILYCAGQIDYKYSVSSISDRCIHHLIDGYETLYMNGQKKENSFLLFKEAINCANSNNDISLLKLCYIGILNYQQFTYNSITREKYSYLKEYQTLLQNDLDSIWYFVHLIDFQFLENKPDKKNVQKSIELLEQLTHKGGMRQFNPFIFSYKGLYFELTNQPDSARVYHLKAHNESGDRPYLKHLKIRSLLRLSRIEHSTTNYRSALMYINKACLLYTSPSPRDRTRSRMPSSA